MLVFRAPAISRRRAVREDRRLAGHPRGLDRLGDVQVPAEHDLGVEVGHDLAGGFLSVALPEPRVVLEAQHERDAVVA